MTSSPTDASVRDFGDRHGGAARTPPVEVQIRRTSVGGRSRTLGTKPALAAQLRTSLQVTGEFMVSGVDAAGVSRVVEKIARALWAFEAGEPVGDAGAVIRCVPVATHGAPELDAFRQPADPGLLPKSGSRMMFRLLGAADQSIANSWVDVQDGRFSHAVEVFTAAGRVTMVLGDFLRRGGSELLCLNAPQCGDLTESLSLSAQVAIVLALRSDGGWRSGYVTSSGAARGAVLSLCLRQRARLRGGAQHSRGRGSRRVRSGCPSAWRIPRSCSLICARHSTRLDPEDPCWFDSPL